MVEVFQANLRQGAVLVGSSFGKPSDEPPDNSVEESPLIGGQRLISPLVLSGDVPALGRGQFADPLQHLEVNTEPFCRLTPTTWSSLR